MPPKIKITIHSPQLNDIHEKSLYTLSQLSTQPSSLLYLLLSNAFQDSTSPLPSKIPMIFNFKAAIQHVTNPLYKGKTSPITIFIQNILQYFMHFLHCKIEFIWVPSHSGIPGNKLVDQLTRAVTLLDSTFHFRLTQTSHPIFKNPTHKSGLTLQKEYKNINNNSHYFHLEPELTPKPWFVDFTHFLATP